MKTGYVYALIDPITKQERYIGSTLWLKQREIQHLQSGRNYSTNIPAVYKWVNELCLLGMQPIMQPIAEVPANDLLFWEAYYYDCYKHSGLLFNTPIYKSPSDKPKSIPFNGEKIHRNRFHSICKLIKKGYSDIDILTKYQDITMRQLLEIKKESFGFHQ